MKYRHISQLFVNSDHRITKSHCFLCHRPLTVNKKYRGNCCVDCDYRANRVAKYIITEEYADAELNSIRQELDVEVWNIDGEDYYKHPNGELETIYERTKRDSIEDNISQEYQKISQ